MKIDSRSCLIALCLVASGLAAGACRRTEATTGATAPVNTGAQVHPDYDKSTGKLTRLDYSSKGDGRIDTWGYMDGSRVVRVEVDENGDGKVDRWEYHDERSDDQAGPDKTLTRIEQATRQDGRVSRWEYFDHGTLTRIEEDTDGDGKVDKWENYTAGTLTMMALDTMRRGTPDRRLIYKPDGSLDHVEADPSGTGVFHPITQGKP